MKKLMLILGILFFTLVCNAQVIVKKYHDNGSLKELLVYNDSLKLDGVCKCWNAEGKLIAKARYVNGKKSGTWKIWHDNGRLAYVFKFDNGIKVGKAKMFDTNGTLVVSKSY
jgi:antitoxin component YwqK of YwqJK toxin-antitoxin module